MRDRAQDLNQLRWTTGNFRLDKTSRHSPSKASKAAAKRAAREGADLEHLACVRQLWCTLGHERGEGQIHCHHLRCGAARKERSFGVKPGDRWVVPLVWFRHDTVEHLGSRNEFAHFMDEAGINPLHLAEALYAQDDVVNMGRVLTAHQLQGTSNLLIPGWRRKWRAAYYGE